MSIVNPRSCRPQIVGNRGLAGGIISGIPSSGSTGQNHDLSYPQDCGMNRQRGGAASADRRDYSTSYGHIGRYA
jgi:hypothetical protein